MKGMNDDWVFKAVVHAIANSYPADPEWKTEKLLRAIESRLKDREREIVNSCLDAIRS